MKKLSFLAPYETTDLLFDRKNKERIGRLCEIVSHGFAPAERETVVPRAIEQAEIVISGWGMPKLTEDLLDRASRLKIVIYGASSVKYFLTEQVFSRGITVTSSAAANGTSVAEFTVAVITLSLKGVWPMIRREVDVPACFRRELPWFDRGGWYGATVGIIGASSVGKEVLRLLRSYDCRKLLFDPFIDDEQAESLGAELVQLDRLLSESHVVSLHAPNLGGLRHMIGQEELSLMRDGCWFINTARGALVDEVSLRRELSRGRINACLDVTDPEPPTADDPLFSLPNVVITPHMAGAIGADCRRMGDLCVLELMRYLRGLPPLYPVRPELLDRMN